MSKPETHPRDQIAALLIYGTNVSQAILEMLSIQFELFFEELDRQHSAVGSARLAWTTLASSIGGNRVLIAPASYPEGATRVLKDLLDRVRRGVSMLSRRAQRPPGFSRLALEHLEWIAREVGSSGVTRLVFLTGGEAVTISQAVLRNLRRLNEPEEPTGRTDVRSR